MDGLRKKKYFSKRTPDAFHPKRQAFFMVAEATRDGDVDR
jgi:hypothetical protein